MLNDKIGPIPLPWGGVIIDVNKFLKSHRSYVNKFKQQKYYSKNKKKGIGMYEKRLRWVEKYLKENGIQLTPAQTTSLVKSIFNSADDS